MNEAKDRLVDMGFTALECDIYLHLLQHGRCTGYAIAKAIGKAVANTYKGIESLRTKGAIEVSEEAKSRLCKAVPWRIFLETHRAAYQANLQSLENALEALPEAEDDEAVYQVDNPAQVIAAANTAINEATMVIFADIEPGILSKVSASLVEAAARGVEVRIKIYEPTDLPGVHITLRQRGKEVYERTADVKLHINADGKQDVLALFNSDLSRVLQAFTTKSGLMNMSHYCGLLYELILTEIKQNLRAGNFQAAVQNLTDTDHLHPFSADGPPLEGFIRKYDRLTENHARKK